MKNYNKNVEKSKTTLHYKLLFLIFCLIFVSTLFICIKNTNFYLPKLFNDIHYRIKLKDKSIFYNMIYPRYNHTATKLDNGNIIFIGGGSNFSEIYDSKNGVFIKGPKCKYDRYMHNTVKLPDGNLLIFGGHDETNQNSKIKEIELYDWKKQKFSVLMELNRQLFCPKSAILNNGNILVISSKISGDETFSGLPEIINLKSKTSQVITNFPENFCSYFEESIIPIKVDNNIIFYKLKMNSDTKNLIWDGKNFQKINGLRFFDKTWKIILPIGNNKIFYSKSFFKNKNAYNQVGIFDLKTNINKTLLNIQRSSEYNSFIPANITEIKNSNIIIAGGKTNTPKSKTKYSQDVYLYNQNNVRKIGLLYNKTLINFSISDLENGKLLICGGRTENNQHGFKQYKATNKCQIMSYIEE